MVEDSLDGERPGRRLRLSVARAGLRERAHQARLAGQKALRRHFTSRWGIFLTAGFLLPILPNEFKAPPPPGRAWQATAALDVLMAIAAFTGLALLAGTLAAVPAFVRYVRVGGWPEIRRRTAWTAGATAVAGGALAGLVLASRAQSFSRLNESWVYLAGVLAADLALVVALWLWTSLVTAMAKRLDLAPGYGRPRRCWARRLRPRYPR